MAMSGSVAEWLCHPQVMTDTGGDLSYTGSKEQASLLSTHRVLKAMTSGHYLCDSRTWKMLHEHPDHDQYLECAGPGCPPQGLAEHLGVPKPLASVAAAFKMSLISSWGSSASDVG